MRKSYDCDFLGDDNGTVVGINLGADSCAEHEWGIKDLTRYFGIPETGLGIEKRTITKLPSITKIVDFKTQEKKEFSYVKFIDNKKKTALFVSRYVCEDYFSDKEVTNYKDELACAWDEGSFGISAIKEDDRQALREIYEAMQKLDLAIWVGGGHVFKNGGLILGIVSRLPKDKLSEMKEADIDREKLLKASEDTGIANRLKEAGKSYFALSPRWKTSDDSKYPVIFWLNPMEQHIHNYGWWTVEQLDLWAKSEGPIMKKEKQNAN